MARATFGIAFDQLGELGGLARNGDHRLPMSALRIEGPASAIGCHDELGSGRLHAGDGVVERGAARTGDRTLIGVGKGFVDGLCSMVYRDVEFAAACAAHEVASSGRNGLSLPYSGLEVDNLFVGQRVGLGDDGNKIDTGM